MDDLFVSLLLTILINDDWGYYEMEYGKHNFDQLEGYCKCGYCKEEKRRNEEYEKKRQVETRNEREKWALHKAKIKYQACEDWKGICPHCKGTPIIDSYGWKCQDCSKELFELEYIPDFNKNKDNSDEKK